MTKEQIVKHLRTRGFVGVVSKQTAIDYGYSPSGPESEWETPEPAHVGDVKHEASPVLLSPVQPSAAIISVPIPPNEA